MNITEANAVNTILRALLEMPFAPDKTRTEQAAVLTDAAAMLADRAHRALSAGLTPQDVLDRLCQVEPLPVLSDLVDGHGNPQYRLADHIEAAFLCYRSGTVGFLANGAGDFKRLMEMLADAAVAVVHAAGIEPPTE